MNKKLNILFLEDSWEDAQIVVHAIHNSGYKVKMNRVDTYSDFNKEVRKSDYDIVLADYLVPGFGGEEALELTRKLNPDLPFIIISGSIGEDTAVRLMRKGANDYLLKDNTSRLVPAIEREIEERRNRIKRKEFENKNKFQADLLNSVGQIIIATNIKTEIIYWSKSAEAEFGLTGEEALGKKVNVAFPNKFSGKKLQTLINRLKNGEIVKEYIHIDEGDTKSFSIIISPMLEKNNITGLIITAENVTEEFAVRKDLLYSEEKNRALSEATEEAIIFSNKNVITECNASAIKMFGYSYEELIGSSVMELVSKNENTISKKYFNSQNAAPKEVLALKKDGTEFWTEIVNKVYPYRNNDINVVSIRDISGRKQAQDELVEKEKYLESIFKSSPVGIIVVRDRKLDFVNEKFCKLSGYSSSELLNKNVSFLYSSVDEYNKMGKEIYDQIYKRSFSEVKTQMRTKENGLLDVFMTSTPKDETNLDLGITTAVMDISNVVKLNEELKKSNIEIRNLAEHLQYVREEERKFLAREIHDNLGQGLTALKIDESWIKRRLSDDQKEIVEKITGMEEITLSLIKLSQKITADLRPGILDDLGLVTACSWQLKEFEKRNNIKCNLENNNLFLFIPTNLGIVFYRILQESLTNISRHSEATEVSVSLTLTPKKVFEFKIVDNGKGINKDEIEGNASFGLIGMRERVHTIGGDFKIYGSHNKGTTITVTVDVGEYLDAEN